MNTEVKRASHTQKVPHIGLPQNPPVTNVNKVEKAPISVPVPEYILISIEFQKWIVQKLALVGSCHFENHGLPGPDRPSVGSLNLPDGSANGGQSGPWMPHRAIYNAGPLAFENRDQRRPAICL